MVLKKKIHILISMAIILSACVYMAVSSFDNKDYYAYVDSRIEGMMKNPKAMIFSDSGKYIEMSKNEYLEIYKLGSNAIPVLEKMMKEEEAKGIRGLKYVLAGQIKQDILDRNNYFDRK